MKILLLGGTTEGRQLAAALTGQGHEVTVCVATELGAEQIISHPAPCPEDGKKRGCPGTLQIRVGRMNAADMKTALEGCDLCVDATHPYALVVSAQVREICSETGVPLRRVLRSLSEEEPAAGDDQTAECFRAASAEEAAAYLLPKDGNVLLTTGAKELPAFGGIPAERLYARVLPTKEGIAACEAAGLPHRQIIAMQGPFSKELNIALLRQYRIRYLVTKVTGRAGGYQEKLEAAKETGASVVLVMPPDEDGISCEELLRQTANPETSGMDEEGRREG